MSTRMFEIMLTIVVPTEDPIQVSVSSPRPIHTQPRQAPSAPVKQMPALVDNDQEESQSSSHHAAARSLYAEFNLTQQPIEPFDSTSAKPYDFSIKPLPSHYKANLILSLKSNGAVDVPLEHYRRLKDFLANVNYIRGHTTPEHVVDLFQQYESWVKTLPEKEARHLNRYQRMARFLK